MNAEDWVRFMDKVEITETCWIWVGCKNHAGVGLFHLDGILRIASRVVLEEHLGRPIGEGKVAAHTPLICHNRSCVNPEHLREATLTENSQDRIIDGTDARGSKNGRSKLTEADIPLIRADTRKLPVIAKDYGFPVSTIANVRYRYAWKHIP